MKDKNYSPYASFSFDKINAPKGKVKNEPKTKKRVTKGDFRVKGGK